jgi:hypothetical protein
MIFVREAGPEDIEAIRMVNEQAFGQFRRKMFAAIMRIVIAIFPKLLKNFL